eukprot:549593-Pyramimonas_sp.AAC.1
MGACATRPRAPCPAAALRAAAWDPRELRLGRAYSEHRENFKVIKYPERNAQGQRARQQISRGEGHDA